MRRIDRYLLKEMVVPAFVGGVLVLMLLLGNQLYGLLKFLYQGVPVRDVLQALLFFIPWILMTAIPAGLLLGAALALNRLERDREILSLRMAGVRLKRVVLPIIVLGLLAAGGMFYLQEKIIPYCQHEAIALTMRIGLNRPTAIIQNDTVTKVGDFLIYVRQMDSSQQLLRGVVIAQLNHRNGYPTWITIPEAENHNGVWTFHADPRTHEPVRTFSIPSQGEEIYVAEAGSGRLGLPKDLLNQVYSQQRTPQELTLRELLVMNKAVRGTAGRYGYSVVMMPRQQLFWINRKIADPLAALVAVLIAIPLAVHFGRSGGYVGLLLAVLIAFFFVISQQWAQVLAETDRAHPIIAAWAPNAVFGLLGIILLMREE